MTTCGFVLAAVAIVCPVAMAQPWRDDFDAAKLDSRWTWHVPVPGPTVSLTERPGWLRLTVPQTDKGFNHWVGEQRAPFLKTPAPEGDWDLTAKVTLSDCTPNSNIHLALVVGFSDVQALAWGPFLSKALYPDMKGPTVWAEPTGQGAYIRTDVAPTNVALQIAKRMDTYHLRHRSEGQRDWTTAGSWYGGGLKPQFVGLMGKSFAANPAGALDVDYVELQPAPPTPPAEPLKASVTIGQLTGRRLPPLQRGFFLEFIGHCIFQGIWDERLHNRKFIGPDTAGVVWKWEATGQAKGYAADTREPYTEPQSQRIDLGESEAGIAQRGLGLEQGARCAIRVVLKAAGGVRAVRVGLEDEQGALASHAFTLKGGDWQTHSCELTPARATKNGLFTVEAQGPGQLWVGAASLMRADNVQGYRRDMLELTKLAKPPTFRWPGGNMASGYHWRDGIGPQDRRPMRWDRAWKAWVDNDMGTDELIAYCRLLGAEPCLCVNAGEGTADEAAAWVEYCNGAADTPMGKLRAANGHPEPFRVKYWDIGNEIWGPWQLGHVPPEQYGLRAVEFARAMRKVDPSIVLIVSGVLGRTFGDWNRKMLRICGPFVDMLSVHDYTEYDARQCTDATWQTVVSAPLRIERSLLETVKLAEEAAGKRLPLTFDEWNSVPKGARGGHGLVDALYAAGVLHAMQRCGDDVPIGNLALLANALGALRCNATQAYETPTFLVFRLFADHSGPWDISAKAEGPQFGNVPALDVAATMSEDKSILYVTLINRHPRCGLIVDWHLGALNPHGEVKVTTLAGPEPWARNAFEGPETVTLRPQALVWPEAAQRPIPPACVTALAIRLR